jgi:hypothetical protein
VQVGLRLEHLCNAIRRWCHQCGCRFHLLWTLYAAADAARLVRSVIQVSGFFRECSVLRCHATGESWCDAGSRDVGVIQCCVEVGMGDWAGLQSGGGVRETAGYWEWIQVGRSQADRDGFDFSS